MAFGNHFLSSPLLRDLVRPRVEGVVEGVADDKGVVWREGEGANVGKGESGGVETAA